MVGDDMLEIDMASKYGILFVRLFGELTKTTRKKLNQEVGDLIREVGILNVVFNLENVSVLDESGFKTLIRCYKLCTHSMFCFSKNKFDFDFSLFNVVTDEVSAVKFINV